MSPKRCVCGSGNIAEECCAPALRGELPAPTAERLMRSRFSAFALGNSAYLLTSWHPSTRPTSLDLDSGLDWYRLDITRTAAGKLFDTTGVVEFTAFYRSGIEAGSQREVSRFVRENGLWYYLDGE